MDTYKAKKLEVLLKGKDFQGYQILNFINNGKSAAVFKAKNSSNEFVAIKIFDNEFVERFGHEIQVKRIEQEIDLKNHGIPNLIKIIDGGKQKIDDEDYYFIIMEYIDGVNLKQYIETNEIKIEFIIKVIQTLVNTTERLIEKEKVHRDIKPENIMVSKDNITLMDLGVLKLIGAKSFSDEEEKQFVGTLRYAPPEFLTREEHNTVEGWRAINLYQIGGVVHDLIMKKELFHDEVPYSKIVYAIKENTPSIINKDFPFGTIQLARSLLIKDWKKRLAVNSIKQIVDYCDQTYEPKNDLQKEIESIKNLTIEHIAKFEEIQKITSTKEQKRKRRITTSQEVEKCINNCFNKLKSEAIFEVVKASHPFYFPNENAEQEDRFLKNLVFKISGTLSQGFSRPLFILLRIFNDENTFVEIEIAGFVSSHNIQSLEDPVSIFKEIGRTRTSFSVSNYGSVFFFKPITVYKGVFEKNDEQTLDFILLKITKLINFALKRLSGEVVEELEKNKRIAESSKSINIYEMNPRQTIVIDESVTKLE